MKTFGVTDYTTLVSLKCCGGMDGRLDGWSEPTTRPAFAKATQVKIKTSESIYLCLAFV